MLSQHYQNTEITVLLMIIDRHTYLTTQSLVEDNKIIFSHI